MFLAMFEEIATRFDVVAAWTTARSHKQPIDIRSITANADPWMETNARTMIYFLPDLSDESTALWSRVAFYDTIMKHLQTNIVDW